jgi:chaperonin GroEL
LGQHGTITIEDSNGTDTRVELIEGFQFDCGMFSPHFITNTAKNTCEIENSYLLVVEGKIADVNQVWPIMQEVAKSGKGLVIIAEDFDFSVPTAMLNNRATFKSCIIKYNFSGDTKQEIMYDLCAVAGATIAEKKGAKIESLGIEYLGQCEKMIISKDETIIIKGKNSAKEMEARIQDAKVKIENAKHPFIKQKQEKRLAKLSGCMAVCYVGGATEVEISEKKDRIDDSIRATKAAIEMGVVAGGGTALLRCGQYLEYAHQNTDIQNGIFIVKTSCFSPAKQIIKNAVDTVETYILDVSRREGNEGYNVATGEIEDLIKSGIVDPVKVVATCIENAVSAAGQVLMSEALIVSDNS